MPSPKQIRDLNKLGIKLEYYDSIQSLIDILKILDSNNVYIRKIGHDQTVRDLVQRSEISIETIERLGIDLDYPIGFKMHQLKSTYSHRREKLKEEQIKDLDEMEISLEVNANKVADFLDKLKRLESIGVNVSLISSLDTIRSLVEKSNQTMEENLQVSIESVREAKLDPNESIGNSLKHIRCAYRGIEEGKKMPTNEQVYELTLMGITLERQKKPRGSDIGKAGFGSGEQICEAAEQDLTTRIERISSQGKGGE